MPNYTEKEIAAFKRKDLLNSRFSAIKAASINFEGKGLDVEQMKSFADEIFSWIRQDQEDAPKIPEVASATAVLPLPTVEQKKVVDAITLQLFNSGYVWDVGFINKEILRYSVEVAKKDKPTYPTTMLAVEPIVKWLKNVNYVSD